MIKINLKFLAKLFILFMFYSFVGYVYEIANETFIHHWKFMPREFLRGPVCPIYGVGGVCLFLVFKKLLDNKKINILIKTIIIFVGSVIITSIIEYIASFILEYFTGGWPWEGYSNYFMNFGGRVSLPTSLKFGILAIIFLMGFYNFIEKFIKYLDEKNFLIKFALILLFIYALDNIFAVIYPTNVKLNVEREVFEFNFFK